MLVQGIEPQRVPQTRSHLIPAGFTHRRRARRSRDHRADHHVDRHHVQRDVGGSREVRQHALPVGQDHRLGHLEAFDPPRRGSLQRALDDGRSHDRQRHPPVGAHLLDGPLGQRLGEGVAVGPAQAQRPLPARLDQLLCAPTAGAAARTRWRSPAARRRPGPVSRRRATTPEPRAYGCPPRPARAARRQRSASARQSTVCGCRPSGTQPDRRPATYAVLTCSTCGRAPVARTASNRASVPATLVRKPSSIGGSKLTSPAQCTTTSMSGGNSPSRAPRSPSTTSSRVPTRPSTALSPSRAPQRGKGRLAQQRLDPRHGRLASAAPDDDGDARVGQVGQDALEQGFPDKSGRSGQQHMRTRQTLGQPHGGQP